MTTSIGSVSFEYLAQRFKPRAESAQRLLLFVAPAGEIISWAGVPRKAFDYQHGFQRTLNAGRVKEVAAYYVADKHNISPTSVVIGFTSGLTIDVVDRSTANDRSELVRVRVTMPALRDMALGELANRALAALKLRLPPDVIAAIEADIDTALVEAMRLQDEEVIGDEFGVLVEGDGNDVNLDPQERSYLADFYAQLIGYKNRLIEWPEEELLRETLYSVLKPAVIVDGQHRVFGASTIDQNMLLSVSAMPESTWSDSVFQFVVINQKAKPIKPAFLSAIVATSLSAAEIDAVYSRLQASKIDVERAQEMERVNTDPLSPFKGMIDFEVEGSPGFLQFPGMLRLVRDFAAIPRTHPVLLPSGVWDGQSGEWMDQFFGLWRGVRLEFEGVDDRLWQRPTEERPNNLLKIVTLQEVQRMMLDTWADGRTVQFTNVTETEHQASKFWTGFPPAFFTDEWRKKGLQTSVGRRILHDAMTETRRNIGRKGWGHRRLGLFSE